VVFFLGTPVSSTNKTDCHDITEILLKVAVNCTLENKLLYTLDGQSPFYRNATHLIFDSSQITGQEYEE
jgi:hypothetical protein